MDQSASKEMLVRRNVLLSVSAMLIAVLACAESAPAGTQPSAAQPTSSLDPSTTSGFASDGTAFGFFPSPPEPGLESVLGHFQDLGEHADFILIQPNIPWADFVDGIAGESQEREDLRNQTILARQNGLEWIFIVDPLNGLDRTEFFGLPPGWDPSFADPNVRAAYTNFALWIVREFQPAYLGMASEINTYMDAHPDDVENFLSLYEETYDAVKLEAPGTSVFVTFQWDDLNNVIPTVSEGRQPYDTNWDQVETFEPRLDVWAISSYPYFVFNGGTPIPADYYTPLLERTAKPLAVAEGGFSSQTVGPVQASPEGQVAYLEAIHDQLGPRLDFWVYILLNDLNMEAIADVMQDEGRTESDIETLSLFASVGLRQADGTPKPALEVWDTYRGGR